MLGVVHTPCQENTHWAEKGRGAFKRASKGGEDTKLECATFSEADEGLAVVASASPAMPGPGRFFAAVKSPPRPGQGQATFFIGFRARVRALWLCGGVGFVIKYDVPQEKGRCCHG